VNSAPTHNKPPRERRPAHQLPAVRKVAAGGGRAGGDSPALSVAGAPRRPCRPDEPPPTAQTPVSYDLLEQQNRLRRAREGRLRALWQMSAAERVAAMRRGQLTYEQLAAWSARHPEQVPLVNGEFEWLVMFTPEVCE